MTMRPHDDPLPPAWEPPPLFEDLHPAHFPTPAELRMALPEGLDEARAAIRDMLARLDREALARGGAPPPHDEALASFLLRCVNAAYEEEPGLYDVIRARRQAARPRARRKPRRWGARPGKKK